MFGKFVDTMIMSACSFAFYAFIRCGKFTIQKGNQDNMLSVTDIMMDDSMNAFTLVLKCSKTDPFHQGISLRIFKSGKSVGPVNAIVEYLKIHNIWNNGSESPALFI